MEIIKIGDVITLRPLRPNWLSFAKMKKADNDFLIEREDIILNEGRFDFEKESLLHIKRPYLLFYY